MNRTALTEKILDNARQLGFLLAGIALPGKTESFGRFTDWLASGHHGQMAYLARPDTLVKRANNTLMLPSAKSVLVLGLPYFAQRHTPIMPTQPGYGRVAAYAWGTDYHLVIPQKLQALVENIRQYCDEPFEYAIHTDSAPILERELAVKAGLGWVGKSGMVISPAHGSYFLLSEVFLSLALEPSDKIVSDHCGNCQRCIDACPTQCILPNRTINANRCISNITIENKGDIPIDYANLIGDWIFGCDVCQQVCPWNIRFSTTKADKSLALDKENRTLNLHTVLATSTTELKANYLNSPISRAKPAGIKRNALAVLANDPTTDAIDIALAAQQDADPLVTRAATIALQRIQKNDPHS